RGGPPGHVAGGPRVGGPRALGLAGEPRPALDRSSVLRALPLALAGVHADPARPGRDLAPPVVFVVRFGATFALAELSYRYVEAPVRRGSLGRAWQALRSPAPEAAATRSRIALAGGASVLVVSLLTLGMVRAQP